MKILQVAVLSACMLTGATWAASDGKALFKENCEKCHGSDGQAHTSRGYLYLARNFTSPQWQARRSDEDIFNTISNSPGWFSMMPAFKDTLSVSDRQALVKVVRGFNQDAGGSSGAGQ